MGHPSSPQSLTSEPGALSSVFGQQRPPKPAAYSQMITLILCRPAQPKSTTATNCMIHCRTRQVSDPAAECPLPSCMKLQTFPSQLVQWLGALSDQRQQETHCLSVELTAPTVRPYCRAKDWADEVRRDRSISSQSTSFWGSSGSTPSLALRRQALKWEWRAICT